jgi:hypothetical protein
MRMALLAYIRQFGGRKVANLISGSDKGASSGAAHNPSHLWQSALIKVGVQRFFGDEEPFSLSSTAKRSEKMHATPRRRQQQCLRPMLDNDRLAAEERVPDIVRGYNVD